MCKLGKPAGAAVASLCRLSALGCERHERDVAGALNGSTELALMSSTIAGDAAWNDLPALGDQVAQAFNVFIVDIRDLIRTETANFFPWKAPFRRHPVVASCAHWRVLRGRLRQELMDVPKRGHHHRPLAPLRSYRRQIPRCPVRGHLWA